MPDQMSDETYLFTQQQILLIATLARRLDVSAFLDRITRAHTMGPILDPTLYRTAARGMGQIEELARALQPFAKLAKQAVGDRP